MADTTTPERPLSAAPISRPVRLWAQSSVSNFWTVSRTLVRLI
jgi:hypothetical protein